MSKSKKLIIGCGNLLLQDEGIGVHLIEYLKTRPVPGDVELLDGGTAGFALIDFIQRADKVIIVDAVKADGLPGQIYLFSPEDFETDNPPKISLHDITLKDVFEIIRKIAALPKIKIIGIEPKVIDYGMEISPELKLLLPEIADLALKEIEKI